MKKFLIAAALSFVIFGGQTEAAQVEPLDNQLETQEQGKWAHFRDKYILDRETENERRDRKDWERRPRYDPPPRHRHEPPPRHDYGPPPPPHHRYDPPPRYGHDYPPPPPPRRR